MSSSFSLVDLAAGPTDDVVVASRYDGAAQWVFEVRRYDATGALVDVHPDSGNAFNAGYLVTSSIAVDAQNDVDYGMLESGLIEGVTSQGADLAFTKLDRCGNALFVTQDEASYKTNSPPPSLSQIQPLGTDASGNLYAYLQSSAPATYASGLYLTSSTGTSLGVVAPSWFLASPSAPFAPTLAPSPDGHLYVALPLTTSTDLGCGVLTVPAAGGMALAELTASGACVWSKLLGVPAAAKPSGSFAVGGTARPRSRSATQGRSISAPGP